MNQRDALSPTPEPDNADNRLPLHPSLHASFVALPPAGVVLTSKQLQAIFGGDLRALRDLAQLAYHSDETESE